MIETVEKTNNEGGKYFISADATYIDDRTHVLNHCDTFAITSRSGDILPFGKEIHGIYHNDTRYVNSLQLRLNGETPTLLSSNIKEENEILSVDLANPQIVLEGGKTIQQGTIHIHRSQLVRDKRFHEKIEIVNHNGRELEVNLSMDFDGDFKDIFEVRGLNRKKRGKFLGFTYPDSCKMVFAYQGLDKVIRRCEISFNCNFTLDNEKNGRINFGLKLVPNELVHIEYSLSFKEDNEEVEVDDYLEAKQYVEKELSHAKSYFPVIETSNEHFTHWLNRSKADLISLMADTPYGKYPYAGVPWYNTAFGRDGIITALETLWIAPRLSKDVLLYLSANQAEDLNEASDAEPGKIMHETRGGEMVALGELPFEKYYGTIDATPLFVLLAGEYYTRTNDVETIRKIWPNIIRAIDWINKFGDLDGDGFVEYQHKAENGLTNQGWKDSHDSVFYEDGTLAQTPIALCEVQAYVYGAKSHAANLAQVLDDKKLAETWRYEAKLLKEKFNEVFWDKQMECYFLALDGNKRPCRVKTSNAGHALFTGIADPRKAKKLVKTLMKPDMLSGWGIRTLSNREVRYNPMSYHNGSVWPHDVALIAEGMARYGYQKEALEVMTQLFDASLFMNLQRLPELYCGMPKRKGEGPTAYPVACSPQAWSVAAVFMLLKAILQINIISSKKKITLRKPILPSYLKRVFIKGLELKDESVEIELNRNKKDNMVGVNWNYAGQEWELSVVK